MARRYWLALLCGDSVDRRRVHAEDADHAGPGHRGARRNRRDLRELSRGRRVGDAKRALPRVPHRGAHGRPRPASGFTAGIPTSKVPAAYTCHDEHEGRDADIVELECRTRSRTSTPTFRCSARTTKSPCAGCHAEGTEFRAAPRTCIGCHADDDAARGRARADVRRLSRQRPRGAARRSITRRVFALDRQARGDAVRGCHENQSFAARAEGMRRLPSRRRRSPRPQRRAMRQLPQRRRLERGELRPRRRQRASRCAAATNA